MEATYNINTCKMFSWPPSSFKKAVFYNFFPTKEEEEAGEVEPGRADYGRVVVEIRDLIPPPATDPNDPWVIKKTLNHDEIDSGKLVLTWHDTFEHVLRYWSLSCANSVVVEGQQVDVSIWDVTQEKNHRKYDEMDGAHMHMSESCDFYITCRPLMKDSHNLKVDDEIGLYWDYHKSCFMFKLFLNVT